MKTTAQRFNELPESEKAKMVTSFGKWVWFTDVGKCRVSVYELRGHFVEIWFDYYAKQITQVRIPPYEELDIHLKSIFLPHNILK